MPELNFADLPPDKKAEVVTLFHEAARQRALQWGAEAKIEKILGRDIDVDFQLFAGVVDTLRPYDSYFTEEDVRDALDKPHP
jgi:hypothetical protein